MHSFAAVSGLAGALRMDPAHALATGVLWYTGFFVAAHVVIVPFVASFLAMRDRMARFVRGIIEEELIRFDLRTYQRQFQRVFPKMTPPDDNEGTR